METKKDKKIRPEIESLERTFKKQKWIRYKEFNYTKTPYYKKIVFTFPNKIKTSTFLKKEDYLLWRIKLLKMVK